MSSLLPVSEMEYAYCTLIEESFPTGNLGAAEVRSQVLRGEVMRVGVG